MLPHFVYHGVRTISETVQLLAEYTGEAKILAGGTDLLLQMKQGDVWGKPCPQHLVSMRNVTHLKCLQLQDDHICIGANVTHREVELSPLVTERLTALHDATCQVGSVQIRNVATLSGNICNAAPSADTAAPLLALGAVAKVVGPKGERRIALTDFYLGAGRSVLQPDEALVEINLPKPPAFSGSAYSKVARRKAMDLAIVGIAVYLSCTPDKSHVTEARIGLSTAAPVPIRAYGAERLLKGARVCEESLTEAADRASIEASPRTSFRSTSEYRREMIRIFVRRSLQKALERIEPESK